MLANETLVTSGNVCRGTQFCAVPVKWKNRELRAIRKKNECFKGFGKGLIKRWSKLKEIVNSSWEIVAGN